MRFLALWLFLLLPFPQTVLADVVHLKGGRTVEGTTEDLGEYVKVTTVTGSAIKFPKSMIVKVEEKREPREVHRERLGRLKADDAAGHLELAQWCKEHDLTEEYGRLLERILAIDPEHAEAKKLLYEYGKYERPLAVNQEACDRLLAEFGAAYEIHRTPHYRICYNCDKAFLQRRAVLFEKTYERFYRFFEEKGYTLEVVPDRLEAVLFDSREDFVHYIKVGQHRVPRPPRGYIPVGMVNSAGLYCGGSRRVYFYNALNDEEYQKARKQAARISVSRVTPESRERFREYKKRLSLKGRRDQNVSVTVHEAVHQLTFNLGLLPPTCATPLWVTEGLAVYFEAASGGHWYGAGRVNRERLDVYRRASRLPRLRSLLLNDRIFQSGTMNSIALSYASAWALTYYLFEERPEEFVRYLRLLREAKRTGRSRGADRLHDFTSVFGADVDAFEIEWREFMTKVK